MSLQRDAREIEILSNPATDLVLSVTSYERVLKRTLLFAVGEVRCPPSHPLFKEGGGPQSCPYIDFMRSSVIRATDSHRPAVLTPNCANFQNVGSSYRRQILDERGDFNDWIAVSPSFLAELSGDRASSSRAADGIFFDKELAPITPRQYMAQRHLNEMLKANADLSDLAFDEYLARSVHCSISKLVRIFRIETGLSLHAYQQQVRIRMSLQLLKESSCDLSEIAAELGFANHSHFTTVFRRQFGVTPSQFRRDASSSLLKRLVETLSDRPAG